jgi:hypothetical protein
MFARRQTVGYKSSQRVRGFCFAAGWVLHEFRPSFATTQSDWMLEMHYSGAILQKKLILRCTCSQGLLLYSRSQMGLQQK